LNPGPGDGRGFAGAEVVDPDVAVAEAPVVLVEEAVLLVVLDGGELALTPGASVEVDLGVVAP
jgi:hypothetical protein